jgi:hypothetical protein
MPTPLFTSETGRAAARRRHDDAPEEQRKRSTADALKARASVPATVAQIDAKVDLLGAAVLDRLDALQAEIAALRSERVAA